MSPGLAVFMFKELPVVILGEAGEEEAEREGEGTWVEEEEVEGVEVGEEAVVMEEEDRRGYAITVRKQGILPGTVPMEEEMEEEGEEEVHVFATRATSQAIFQGTALPSRVKSRGLTAFLLEKGEIGREGEAGGLQLQGRVGDETAVMVIGKPREGGSIGQGYRSWLRRLQLTELEREGMCVRG